MIEEPLLGELRQTGRKLSFWQARATALLGCGFVLLALLALGLADAWGQFSRAPRLAAAVVWAAIAAAFAWRVLRTGIRRHTAESVAASVEHAFPELDNRLINYVQFLRQPRSDHFVNAYLSAGRPPLAQLDVRALRDRRRERHGLALLVGAALLCALPLPFMGRAWPVALYRVLNPFAACPPASRTRILAVAPGDTTVAQGNPLLLQCTVRGHKGHRVRLDISSADGQKTSHDLGRIMHGGEQVFRHHLPEVSAPLTYRFRAGDAPFPAWHRVAVKPPLAFASITFLVQPPVYTHRRPVTYAALMDHVVIPQASRVDITAACNLPAAAMSAHVEPDTTAELVSTDTPGTFAGRITVNTGSPIRLTANDETGDQTETTIGFQFVPDHPPEIDVILPKSRTQVPPGAIPGIRLLIEDDYGLASASLQRVAPGSDPSADGKPVKLWKVQGQTRFRTSWMGDAVTPETDGPLVFRVVARDNYPFEERKVRSAAIVFDTVAANDAARKLADARNRAENRLGEVISMQRDNLRLTRALRAQGAQTGMPAWAPAAEAQARIRTLTGELLRDPSGPLGGMATTVKTLYMDPMQEAATTLKRAAQTPEAEARAPLVARAEKLEAAILRKLTGADASVAATRSRQATAGVVALLAAIVRGQKSVLTSTETMLQRQSRVGRALVERQDNLSADVTEFATTAERQATLAEANNSAFAELVRKVVAELDTREVKADMLRAAEKLEADQPGQALPLQKRILAGLRELLDLLNAWQVAEAEQRVEEMGEVLAGVGSRLEKLREVEGKVIEAMRELNSQADRSDEERDLIEEEIDAAQEQVSQALLQIARDLHIFPELSVANELVEDVYSVFEEVRQKEGSEHWTAEDVEEWGVLKPEVLIEMMEEAEDHVELMEQWLPEAPDKVDYDMEPFDREEMPKLALGGLESAVEDLIGDLLEESEALAEAADDSATNLRAPQNEVPGWEVAEGPQENFGAQGSSGNQVPDNKEQSGRSIVGRQGQAIGETAAGSGTISEGDPTIENRLTPEPLQSGQVQVEGEAEESATGGGKQTSGSAAEYGMGGAGSETRMDTPAGGGAQGLKALMARTESLTIKASLINLRTASLKAAAHHIRQANDAIAAGLPIHQIREHQRKAVAALQRAQTELTAGFSQPIADPEDAPVLEDVIEGGVDAAPAPYRDLVAEYFKSLNEAL